MSRVRIQYELGGLSRAHLHEEKKITHSIQHIWDAKWKRVEVVIARFDSSKLMPAFGGDFMVSWSIKEIGKKEVKFFFKFCSSTEAVKCFHSASGGSSRHNTKIIQYIEADWRCQEKWNYFTTKVELRWHSYHSTSWGDAFVKSKKLMESETVNSKKYRDYIQLSSICSTFAKHMLAALSQHLLQGHNWNLFVVRFLSSQEFQSHSDFNEEKKNYIQDNWTNERIVSLFDFIINCVQCTFFHFFYSVELGSTSIWEKNDL